MIAGKTREQKIKAWAKTVEDCKAWKKTFVWLPTRLVDGRMAYVGSVERRGLDGRSPVHFEYRALESSKKPAPKKPDPKKKPADAGVAGALAAKKAAAPLA